MARRLRPYQSPRPKHPHKRKREVVLPAEAARRTRFVKADPPAPATDRLEQLVRQRTAERLSGPILHEALQGKPTDVFLTSEELELFTVKATLRALLPWARQALALDKPEAEMDRLTAWLTRAEAAIL